MEAKSTAQTLDAVRVMRALGFLVGRDGGASTMTFAAVRTPMLPVFGDLISLARMASETGRQPGSYGFGGLPPEQLFAWARAQGFGLAFGAYSGDGNVFYMPLMQDDIDAFLSDPARR
jgi:hypothetical protein